jgi:hypothetical protein
MQYGQLLSYAYIKKHILLGNFNIFVWKINDFFSFQSHLADGRWKPEGGGHQVLRVGAEKGGVPHRAATTRQVKLHIFLLHFVSRLC